MQLEPRILKLREKLRLSVEALDKLSPRQRYLVLGAGALLALLLIYVAVLQPLMALESRWAQELDQKQLLLQRYQALKANKAAVARAFQDLQQALDRAESQLLPGANAAVAAADLQEILKNLTKTHGAQLNSIKVLPPQEAGSYLEIPIAVQLSCQVDQLLTILYHLAYHKKLLWVPVLEINAPRWGSRDKGPPPLRADLVVSGLIKKPAASGA